LLARFVGQEYARIQNPEFVRSKNALLSLFGALA
jgi:hypothetical protein